MRSASVPETSAAAPLGLFGGSFGCGGHYIWLYDCESRCTSFQSSCVDLALQVVCKLQEQAAISDHSIARLQAAGNLRLSVQAFSESNCPSAKLVRTGRSVDKRLILAIAQNSRIR